MVSGLTRFERVLCQGCDPFIGHEDVIADFFAGLLLESFVGLRLDQLLEESGVDGADDVDQELPGRLLLGVELVVHVFLDLVVVLDLCDQVVHAELAVVGQRDPVDLVALEAGLLATKKLADEQAVDIVVLVEITFAASKKSG